MADNLTLNAGSGGATLATDDITDAGGAHYQRVKLSDGTANSTTHIHAGNGTASNALRVTVASDSTGVLSVDDNGASLTIDNADITTLAGAVGTENAATPTTPILVAGRYDLADRTLGDGDIGTVAVDVNGHVITSLHADSLALADNVSNTVKIETDHAGGFVAKGVMPFCFDGSTWDRVRGDATNGLLVNLGANNDVVVSDGGSSITVDGTITANLSATDNAVLDDIAAKLAPNATNGHSFYLNQDTSAVASVKASAGTIYWIACMSTSTAPVYLNLYDVASGSVTLGTTTPSLQFVVPSQGDANGAGFTINFGPLGIQFGTAITIACATTFNGSTDPGTNVVFTNMGYE